MTPSRSVRTRAVAAGVIRSASTRMFPTVWSEITTARVTHTYRVMSSARTRSPAALAISRSSVTATNARCSTATTSSSTVPVVATTTTSRSGIPVIDPNRNCCSDPE